MNKCTLPLWIIISDTSVLIEKIQVTNPHDFKRLSLRIDIKWYQRLYRYSDVLHLLLIPCFIYQMKVCLSMPF